MLSCLKQRNQRTFIQIYTLPVAASYCLRKNLSFVNFCSICTVLSCLKQANQGTFIRIYLLPVAAVFGIKSKELHTAIGKLQRLSDKKHGIKVVNGLMCSDLLWNDWRLQSYKIITLYTDDIVAIWEVEVLHIFNFLLWSTSKENWQATIFKRISIILLIQKQFSYSIHVKELEKNQ